jgi:hypothetical protein
MPRPKPLEPLKGRQIRMSDTEWAMFKSMGGAEWLRKMMGTRPSSYYQVFERPKNDNRNRGTETRKETQGAGVR